MVRSSKQKWEVGQTVKVGFLSLVVRAAIATPGDGLPDVYFLSNQDGTKLYEFIPHNGLHHIELDEAGRRLEAFRKHCEQVVAQELARAAQQSAIRAKFNELFLQAA